MTITIRPRWSLGRGKTLVPSRWQATHDLRFCTSTVLDGPGRSWPVLAGPGPCWPSVGPVAQSQDWCRPDRVREMDAGGVPVSAKTSVDRT
jgi:hypothetical protein